MLEFSSACNKLQMDAQVFIFTIDTCIFEKFIFCLRHDFCHPRIHCQHHHLSAKSGTGPVRSMWVSLYCGVCAIVLYCGFLIPIWYGTTGIVPLYYIVGVTKSTFYLTPQFINRSRLAESSFYELPFACKIHFQIGVSIFAVGDKSSVMIISDFREEYESAELWMIGWGREGGTHHPLRFLEIYLPV